MPTVINNAGAVTGHVFSNAGANPFVYRDGRLKVFREIEGYAYGINARGQIAGYTIGSLASYRLDEHGVVYFSDRRAGLNQAVGLDGRGNLCGSARVDQQIRAAVTINDKPKLLPMSADASESNCRAINAAGDIAVDEAYGPFGTQWRAFVVRNGARRAVPGPAEARVVSARAINISANVTGTFTDETRNSPAFHYRRADDTFTTLGYGDFEGLGYVGLYPSGINARDEIVGTAYSLDWEAPQFQDSAFIWRDGRVHDLNRWLDPVTGAGWVLAEAYAINDRGQIVGRGRLNGRDASFLLLPVTR